jgi:hypothetical protein
MHTTGEWPTLAAMQTSASNAVRPVQAGGGASDNVGCLTDFVLVAEECSVGDWPGCCLVLVLDRVVSSIAECSHELSRAANGHLAKNNIEVTSEPRACAFTGLQDWCRGLQHRRLPEQSNEHLARTYVPPARVPQTGRKLQKHAHSDVSIVFPRRSTGVLSS